MRAANSTASAISTGPIANTSTSLATCSPRVGTKVNRVYRSERDDWILAMVEAGLGFGFMPQYCMPERADSSSGR